MQLDFPAQLEMSWFRRRDWRPLAIAIAFSIALVPAVGFYYRPSGCTLEVWSSQEKSTLLGQMAAKFNATDAGRACSVTVDQIASGTAESALASGWRISGKARPDVWTPAASTWVELLAQDLSSKHGEVGVPSDSPSLAHSPLVIAMPAKMAAVLDWPQRQVGWSDVLNLQRDPNAWASRGHPDWGSFKLGQTDPTKSTSGVHAFIGMFYAAVEVRDRTTAPETLSATDISDLSVLNFVTQIERGIVHYTDTVSTFLDQLRTAGNLYYVSAVAMEEQEVWQYNAGHPNVPLAAMYPREGTLFADHPYVVLTAPWMDSNKRAAAEAFRDFLLSRDQQHSFQRHGFRDHSVPFAVSDPTIIDQADGLLAAEPAVTLAQPSPAVLQDIERSWALVH